MQNQYAQVVIDITSPDLDRTFEYLVPEQLRDRIAPGMVVEVPFGKSSRTVTGYVTGLSDKCSFDPSRIKPLLGIRSDAAGGEEKLVALAAAMKVRYGCSMAQALRTVLPVRKKVRSADRKYICLKASEEEACEALAVMKKKNQKARARLIEALLEEPSVPYELVRDKLGITAPVIRSLEEKGLVFTQTEVTLRKPALPGAEENKETSEGELSDQQRKVVESVLSDIERDGESSGRYLLRGVTGSGKTRVYTELIAHEVAKGKQAIVLIPEIALTWQTVMRFYRRFGERVSFIHSRLSQGERYDQFTAARDGKIDVMIGPRSALFTPFPNLGIIIIDEEQESAYQSEKMPCYHAREAALMRADMEGAALLLGSATPSMEASYAARTGALKLLELNERIGSAALPDVTVVDLKEEYKKGRRSLISRTLEAAIADTLTAGNQVMLFLNRRGFAGFISCRSCGHVIKCPHCDVALSLHKGGSLVCHYCGYTAPMPGKCPECGESFLRPMKAGTEQIEDEVRKLFPEAKVLRMDLDTTRGKDGHAKILSAFAAHEADILVGTQMIVKGHDFPDVTLVGIVAADLSLYVPDFRSAERTFQLLTQAAGRAGRAEKKGRVIVQTYSPDHYAIRCAAAQDDKTFYEEEIAVRSLGGYPPLGRMTAVHMSSEDEQQLGKAAMFLGKFARLAAAKSGGVLVLGPSDELISKIADQYRKVIYLKAQNRSALEEVRSRMEEYIAINEGFDPVTIQYENM